ncbi:MFS transporter [Micromonospora sp. NPDC049559]|uniref:MFS transporter n=1 Tax=Micromonospora sp. NPDC049559 TaxID=3155923 RepID=UPI00344141C7
MSWGTARILGNRDAALYLGAALVSGFGTSAMMLAAGVWVKTLTGSSSLAALTGFCLWAPTLVGPILGVLADRLPRRALLVAVHAGLALLLLPLLAVGSADRVWLVFAVLLGYGVGFVLADAAEAALVPAVVPGELLGDFNGLRMTVSEGMKLVAPLAGAGLFARFGAAPVVLLDAVTFALAAFVFTLLRVRRERPVAAHAGWRRQLAEGVRHLVRHPILRPLVGAAAAIMGLGALRGAALYAIVDDGLHRAPAFAGAIAAVQGVGSILGGLLTGPLLRRLAERAVVAAGIALVSGGIALSAAPWATAVLAGALLAGSGLPSVLIATLTAVQRETPGELTGRVVATTNTLTAVPLVVASLVGAGLITVMDHRLLLALAAGAGLLTAGNCLRPPARRGQTGSPPPTAGDGAGVRAPAGTAWRVRARR